MSSADQIITVLAGRQNGIVTRRQLSSRGISPAAIRHRIASGKLGRVHHGVYAVGAGDLTDAARMRAALFVCGAGSALSHLTAARMWRISRFHAPLIDIVSPMKHQQLDGVRIRRSRHLGSRYVVSRGGFRVTGASRTIFDLADELTPWQLANVLDQASFRRVLNLKHLRRMLIDIPRRRGRGCLTRAIELHLAGSAGTKSMLEDRALAHLLATDLPEPLVNTHVHLARKSFQADFHWPHLRVILEVDGSHDGPFRSADDRSRDRAAERMGWTVLRASGFDVDSRPDELVAAVSTALATPA